MSVIRIEDIAHVRYGAPDLAAMRAFLEDFGMTCFEQDGRLYAKGSDGRPFLHVTEPGEARFLAIGFRAETLADLEALAAHVGAPVEELNEPGGGRIVRLTDPDGYRVEVVAGQARAEGSLSFADLPRNTAAARQRQRSAVRLDPGPSHVRRIGHAVLKVRDFRASEKWYKDRFGFLTSDEVEAARDVPVGAFMRCDRGTEPTDHHTLLCLGLGDSGFDHAAFEVEDFDSVMAGHDHLALASRYEHHAGVGRHILGSQVFDYWRDPWGHVLEHFTDGDLLDASHPTGLHDVATALGTQWGRFA